MQTFFVIDVIERHDKSSSPSTCSIFMMRSAAARAPSGRPALLCPRGLGMSLALTFGDVMPANTQYQA